MKRICVKILNQISMLSQMEAASKSESITVLNTANSKMEFKLLIMSWKCNPIKIGQKLRLMLQIHKIIKAHNSYVMSKI